MKKINKQQQEIAFRCFVTDTKKLLKTLKSGYQLEEVVKDCSVIYGHNCTDGYESEICNMNRWIRLLMTADEDDILPSDVVSFLEYIIFKYSKKRSFSCICKHYLLRISFFASFELAKRTIATDLLYGFTVKGLLKYYSDKNVLVYKWLCLLQEAIKQEIIPGNNLLDFLNFI